jgi:hypothetical protein
MISTMTDKLIAKFLYLFYEILLLHLLYYTHFLHTVKWGFKKSPGCGDFFVLAASALGLMVDAAVFFVVCNYADLGES